MASEDTIRELLQSTKAAYQAGKASYEAQSVAREAAIRLAHEDGLSTRRIAEEIDVSFGLVARIVRRPAARARNGGAGLTR